MINENKYNILDDRHEVLNLYKASCVKCKHFKKDTFNCVAFPDAIPYNILSGENKHLEPTGEQTGNSIVFTAK